jgi:hypothetical protein
MLYNDIEREALKAADDVRRDWLRALEKDLAALPANVGRGNRLMLEHAIRMLRRKLGIKQSAEERRAKARERVARFREKEKSLRERTGRNTKTTGRPSRR